MSCKLFRIASTCQCDLALFIMRKQVGVSRTHVRAAAVDGGELQAFENAEFQGFELGWHVWSTAAALAPDFDGRRECEFIKVGEVG